MKIIGKCIILLLFAFMLSGCGDNNIPNQKGAVNANSVDKVINDQIADEESKIETNESKEILSETESDEDTVYAESLYETEDAIADLDIDGKTEGNVDYDLTQMSSDMVYATVYQMMVTPEECEGKTFRIEGDFYATYYDVTKKYYYYCIIQDATACCAQGLEFVWGDGSHIYPDDYPQENAEIIVDGTFETYREEGDQYLYCRLSDATLQQDNMDKSKNRKKSEHGNK